MPKQSLAHQYCREHRLNKAKLDRWQRQLEGAEAAKKAAELLREQRRQRGHRGPSSLCKSKRSVIVQAFWAMHIEALNWSGLCATHYDRLPISTAFVESTVNEILSKRMIKKQQMRRKGWTAQPFLDVRVAVLNKTLTGSFRRLKHTSSSIMASAFRMRLRGFVGRHAEDGRPAYDRKAQQRFPG